jgi:hypothetical protein
MFVPLATTTKRKQQTSKSSDENFVKKNPENL